MAWSAQSASASSVGQVYVWGIQPPGDGTTTTPTTPVPVGLPAGVTATAVSNGYGQNLVLTSTGAVYAWGDNLGGELGDGTYTARVTPVPVHLPTGTVATGVAAGEFFSLAVTSTGAVYAWGVNNDHQLGNGTTADSPTPTPTPVSLPVGVTATAVSAGGSQGLALTSTGAVYEWGAQGTVLNPVPTLVALPAGVTATAVSAGWDTSMVLASTGSVYAWGENGLFGLGDGTQASSDTPVLVSLPAGATATAVSAGELQDNSFLAVTSTGAVYAWGANTYGQLGDGTLTARLTPVPVALPAGVSAVGVANSGFDGFAVTSTGAVYDWGANGEGELGNGTTTTTGCTCSEVPVQVALPSGVTANTVAQGLAVTGPPPALPDTDLAIGSVAGISVAATSSAGAAVTFAVPTAVDEGGEVPTVICDHQPGDTFAVGETTVTCTASDPDDTPSSVTTTFTVTVTDTDLVLTGVPTGVVVDATSPSGATVDYLAPTAVDEDGTATVTCVPPSGSTFAIGIATVTCTAEGTDDTNGPVQAGFTVRVKGALDQLNDLDAFVAGLPPGRSLPDKVQAAIADYEAAAMANTCGDLSALIREAKAQSGKHLTPAEATVIVDAAAQIEAVIGC